jgi:RNA polymerase sigma-70 factor (ECF subfamily)
MERPLPIPDLLARLRSGDQAAAAELFRRYAQRLAHLAEQHLSRSLAGRLDGQDVVQSVFRTFFERCARGEFRIDSSAQLWQLLVKITILKARAEARRHLAERRDVRAEAAGADAWLAEAVAHEPSAAEAAALVDQVEALLRGLPALYCRVLDMRLQGHAVPDIARELAVSRQTVYRVLHLLQDRLRAAESEQSA